MPTPLQPNFQDCVVTLGPGGSVNCGTSMLLDFPNNTPFTIEGWFLLRGLIDGSFLFSRGTQYSLGLQNNHLVFQLNGNTTTLISTDVPQTDEMNHIAIVYDGVNLILYINGVVDSQQSMPGAAVSLTGTPFLIGPYNGCQVQYVHVWNYALSLGEVNDVLYATAQPSPVLLGYFDFSQIPASDLSGRGNVITLGGGTDYSIATYGLFLNGASYAQAAGATPGASGSHTLEAWFYLNASGNCTIVSTDTNANSVALGVNNGLLNCSLGGASMLSGVTAITTATWYHAAVTYDGTNLILYLNGIQESTAIQNFTWSLSGNILYMGVSSLTYGFTGYLSGYVQDLRLWNIALSADLVLSTIPEYPFGASGLAALLSLEITPPSDLTENYTVTLMNGACIGTTGIAVNPVTGQVTNPDESDQPDQPSQPNKQVQPGPPGQPLPKAGKLPVFNSADEGRYELGRLRVSDMGLPPWKESPLIPSDADLDGMIAVFRQNLAGRGIRGVRQKELVHKFATGLRLEAARHRYATDAYQASPVILRKTDSLVHYYYRHKDGSEVLMGTLPADSDSEQLVWMMQIAFTLLTGVFSLFGLRMKVSSRDGQNIAYLILNHPLAKESLIAMIGKLSADTAIEFLSVLYNQGLLKTIILSLVEIRFFSLLYFLANLAIKIGPGLATFIATLALLIYQLVILIANRPQTKKWLLLTMYQAGGGDSLLFQTYRQNGNDLVTKSMMIDGGKTGTYARISALLPNTLDYVLVTHQDSDHIGGVIRMLQTADKMIGTLLFNSPYVKYNIVPPYNPLPDDDDSDDDDNSGNDQPSLPENLRESANLTYLAQHYTPVIPIQLITQQSPPLAMDYQAVNFIGPSDQNLDIYYTRVRPLLPAPVNAQVPGPIANRASIIHRVVSQENELDILFTGDAWDNQTTPDAGTAYVDIRSALGIYNPPQPPGKQKLTFLKIPHHGSSESEDEEFYKHVLADVYLISGKTSGHPTLNCLKWIVDANTAAGRNFLIYATNNRNGIAGIIADPARRPSVNKHYHLYVLQATSNALTFKIEKKVITYPSIVNQVVELDRWTV